MCCYVLLIVMSPYPHDHFVCMKDTAFGENLVANIALSFSSLLTLCSYKLLAVLKVMHIKFILYNLVYSNCLVLYFIVLVDCIVYDALMYSNYLVFCTYFINIHIVLFKSILIVWYLKYLYNIY